jgi:hypothetical protein
MRPEFWRIQRQVMRISRSMPEMTPVKTALILRIILTPIGGLVGFVAGVVAAMALGLNLYDNYEYFTPFPASSAIPTIIGMCLCYGGAAVGLVAPWIILIVSRRR